METNLVPKEDLIEKFLLSKLTVLQCMRQDLEKQLDRRTQFLEEAQQKERSESTGQALILGQIWKKVIDDKYVIGIQVTNASKEYV